MEREFEEASGAEIGYHCASRSLAKVSRQDRGIAFTVSGLEYAVLSWTVELVVSNLRLSAIAG